MFEKKNCISYFLLLQAKVLLFVIFLSSCSLADNPDPAASDYTGRKGIALYVSKLGDNTDGRSWKTAYNSIQAALSAISDAKGGHRIIIRPDTYMEGNLHTPYKGATGSYNRYILSFRRQEIVCRSVRFDPCAA